MGGGVSASGGELGLNERAWQIADAMAKNAAALRVAVRQLSGGARVIDAGIDATGGFGAGRALAEICTGGLADIAYPPVPIGGETWPGVRVWTDHPAVSCMASQYAGWAIQVGKYFAMGSGPLRAHARVEKELFAKLGYAETARRGVLVLETRTAPTDDVAAWVAEKAGSLEPWQLTFVVAPTASLAGGVQIAARILETGLHKMDTLGFDLKKIVSGIGAAPLPPVAKNDLRDRGQRGGPDPAHDLLQVEAERVHLVEPGLEDARGDLHAAGEARRRRHHEGELPRLETPCLLGHPGGYIVRRRGARFEHQHAAPRGLGVAELREQLLLDARVGAQRPRAHCEVFPDLDRPAGVLGRHAAYRGMVGPDAYPRPVIVADHHGGVVDVPQPAHADLRQRESGGVPSRRLDARVDHPRAAGQRAQRDPQRFSVRRHAVGDLQRATVQVQPPAQSPTHRRISPFPSSAMSPA